jgi:putative transcriptional regulator
MDAKHLIPAKGRVLISEPFLTDPNFSRAVILLTDYSDLGAAGFVLNQLTDFAVNMLLDELPSVSKSVYQGGPVDLETFHYIHTYAEIGGAQELLPNVYWGGNFEQVCTGLADGTFVSSRFKFFIGYSGWAPQQLDLEIAEKAWIVGNLTPAEIFSTTIADTQLWKMAIRHLGGDLSLLANSPKDPNLN